MKKPCPANFFRICASIVTYNPDIPELRENISSLIVNLIEEIIIVDNASKNVEQIQNLITDFPQARFTLIKNEQNEGIAFALNQCLNSADKLGYSWLLTLDQDSTCNENYISSMLPFLDQEKTGMLYPIVKDLKSAGEKSRPVSKLQDFCRKHRHGNQVPVPMPITSGALTNVKAGIESGGFTDYLFIDAVDFDFNLKLYENGYQLVECPEAILFHSLGKQQGHFFGGYYFIASGHPAWRFYYMVRNAWILKYSHRHGIYKKWCAAHLFSWFSPLAILSIFISNYFDRKYLSCIFKGHWDGIRRKIRPHSDIVN